MKNNDEYVEQGYVFEIQRMSTEDGPGIRTTVFFKGCPLRCAWCHNPESLFKLPSIQWFEVKCIGCKNCIEICPENAITLDSKGIRINRQRCNACGKCVEECPTSALRKIGEYWTLDDLISEVKKDKAYYATVGGVTASGGEAGLQHRFVSHFFKRCRELDIHTALDTCGILPRDHYESILKHTDLILYDIKEIDPVKHKQFTGISNDKILSNIVWILETAPQVKIWIRTPIIPNYTATEENVRGIGKFIVERLGNRVEQWDILAYNNLAKDKYERMDLEYRCRDLELLSKREMERFYEIAKSTGVKNVQWSGLTKNEDRIDVKKDVETYEIKALPC